MSITISDIKRAVLCGGSVSPFTEMWRQALGNPPVPIVDSLEVIAGLPEAAALYKHFDGSFEEAMVSWAGNRDRQLLPKEEIDLTLVGLAPFGRNIGAYLERTINQVKPDVIAIDTLPSVLSANMLYAFGIPCALGLPAYGEIMSRDFGQFYAQETFYPGNMNETAIVKSWLSKIPLLPIGVPQKPTQPDSASGYMDGTYIDQLTRKSSLLTAYRALDKNLTGVTNLQDGMKVTRTICDSLMQTIIGKMREGVTEEACYIASRLMEIAAFICTWKRGGRLLAVVDIEHYAD
ncbi:MAG: hypothetical protein V1932_06480, partial [Chloroflexota bacterium]